MTDVATSNASHLPRRLPRRWRRLALAGRRANFHLWIELAAAIALVAMLIVSYIAITKSSGSGELVPATQAAAMLLGTLIPALALIVLGGRRIAIRRAGGAKARLHVNLVFFFSLVAAVPTLLVAVFASVLFQSGVAFWFSDSSRGILENANELARGYYDENQRDVGNETVTMASDLLFVLKDKPTTSPEFADEYIGHVLYRELSESAILHIQANGKVTVEAIVDPEENPDRERVPDDAVKQLLAGEDLIIMASSERIEAVTPIDRDVGLFLYNARNSDPTALGLYQRAQSVLQSYDVLTERARVLQLRFNLALFGVSLMLVGLAVWFALRFADRQVRPLTDLVGAAREVGSGNYALRVGGRTGSDEIGLLNRAFNRMTAQIERQTDALRGANRQLADRRQFIEAVLQSVTAGIISVDSTGAISLMNQSAQKLLFGAEKYVPLGQNLELIAPAISNLIATNVSSGIVQHNKQGADILTLAVTIAPATQGHVVTFEDITRQLLDQRQAAWSDVAQRIAHEIKNPLTPIQLATERLQRRYRKQILVDGELFEELTGTIVRQVAGLRKMVDEFSSFARLPKPVFRREDPADLIRQAVFLQEVGHPAITYEFTSDGADQAFACDRHQFGQAMTNVLKNAAEAIESKAKDSFSQAYQGKIEVSLTSHADSITVRVADNGVGLPLSTDRIIEPYVTTREKGTGLGLAIVKKIVEEHGGEISFSSRNGGGAIASLRFARDPMAGDSGSDTTADKE